MAIYAIVCLRNVLLKPRLLRLAEDGGGAVTDWLGCSMVRPGT